MIRPGSLLPALRNRLHYRRLVRDVDGAAATLGVSVVQLLAVPDTAGIAGKDCVKRFVAA